MKSLQNANQITGRAIGSLFFTVFGALWLLLAFYALEHFNFATIFGIACVALGLIMAARQLLSRAKHWPNAPQNPQLGKVFRNVNIIQYAAIAAVVVACNVFHLAPYLMCGITLVVGLHMFPLAHLYKYNPHYVTGAVLVSWAVISAVALPLEHMQGYSALGTGLLLWLSAAYTLAISLQATSHLLNAQMY